MKTVERANGWLHGDVDCDPRQLVRDLLAVIDMLGHGEPVSSVRHAENRGWPISNDEE